MNNTLTDPFVPKSSHRHRPASIVCSVFSQRDRYLSHSHNEHTSRILVDEDEADQSHILSYSPRCSHSNELDITLSEDVDDSGNVDILINDDDIWTPVCDLNIL